MTVAAPPNRPPVASFRYFPGIPTAGEAADFVSLSSDPDGPLVAQQWDLDGDGQFDDAAGASASRSFTDRREGGPASGDRCRRRQAGPHTRTDGDRGAEAHHHQDPQPVPGGALRRPPYAHGCPDSKPHRRPRLRARRSSSAATSPPARCAGLFDDRRAHRAGRSASGASSGGCGPALCCRCRSPARAASASTPASRYGAASPRNAGTSAWLPERGSRPRARADDRPPHASHRGARRRACSPPPTAWAEPARAVHPSRTPAALAGNRRPGARQAAARSGGAATPERKAPRAHPTGRDTA